MSTLQIHFTEPWAGLRGTPFLITATDEHPKGTIRAEWFLVVPDDANTLFGEEITTPIPPPKTTPYSVGVIEMFLTRSALEAARRKLGGYLQDMSKNSVLPSFVPGDNAIFGLCFLNDFGTSQLKKIAAVTKIGDIAGAIRLAMNNAIRVSRRDLD
jgi:hypothetical protein